MLRASRWLFAIGLLAAGSLVGCETDEVLTGEEQLGGDRVHPVITVDSPQRGTFAAADEITLEGSLTVGTAPIEEVSVDGEAIDWDEEHFETTRSLRPGPNIFGVRVEAEDGGRAVDTITVYGPSTHEPGAVLEHALYMHFGQEIIDNGTAKFDDVAGIAEALLMDEQFLLWMFSEPFEAGDYGTLQITHIETSNAAIELLATPGCLDATIELGAVEPETEGWIEAELDAEGLVSIFGEEVMMYADRVFVQTDLCTVDGSSGVDLETTDPEVEIEGFQLATNEHPDLSESYPNTVESLSETAEDALEEWLGESMADFVADFLEDFGSNYSFGADPEVSASLGVEELEIDEAGISMELFGAFSAPENLSVDTADSGSLAAEFEPLSEDLSEAPMAVAMSIDALNQLLFALWHGGAFEEAVDPELEALGELPAVFQPIEALDYRLWLPPAFVPPTHPEDFFFDFAAGGIDVDLLSDDDRFFDMGLEIQSGVGVDVDKQGRLDLQLDNRPRFITVQAALDAVPEGLDGGDVAALLRMMVPSVLGEIDVIFEGFAIPSVDVGQLGEGLSEFEGRQVRFVPDRIGHAGGEGMYLLVEGSFAEADGD